MKAYKEILEKVLTEGKERTDRTGTGTISIRSASFVHDMSEGFPLLTTKKVNLNAVLGELLWFLRGSTNIQDLRDLTHGRGSDKYTIWQPNADKQAKELGYKNGELGPGYGKQFRNSFIYHNPTEVIQVKVREYPREVTYRKPRLNKKPELPKEGFGEVVDSNCSGLAKILEEVGTSSYRVQFEETGYIGVFTKSNVRSKELRDPWAGKSSMPIVADIKVLKKVYDLWYNLCSRILKDFHPSATWYSGKNVTMDPSWLLLSNFYRDIQGIPGFYEWYVHNEKLELDKDYYGTPHYSKHTCVFLPSRANQGLANKKDHNKAYLAKTSDGVSELFMYQRDLVNLLGFPKETLRTHLKTRGVYERDETTVSVVSSKPGYVFRHKVWYDPVQELLAKAKENPEDRRLIVSLWNTKDMPYMTLPPCHYAHELYIEDGRLDLIFYMRSCDVFLGLPFNIASYATLLSLYAKVLNLEPGVLEGQLTNVHIYNDHIEQVKEQLSRKEYSLPQLIVPEVGSLEEIEQLIPRDFTLVNYQSHPPIKAKMSA